MARSSASTRSAAASVVAPLSEQWWVAQRSPDWAAIRAAKRERAMHDLRRLLERNDRLGIIDVETADFTSGIIELALLDGDGEEQFHERFCPPPHIPISPRATAIHGITEAMVAHLPTFRDRFRAIRPLTEHLILAAYNAPFERRILDAECAWYGAFPRAQPTIVCLMRLYSDYVGIRSFRQGKPINRVQSLKLPRAASDQPRLHNAADDCRAAFQYVIEAMLARRTIAFEDALAGIGGRTPAYAYHPPPAPPVQPTLTPAPPAPAPPVPAPLAPPPAPAPAPPPVQRAPAPAPPPVQPAPPRVYVPHSRTASISSRVWHDRDDQDDGLDAWDEGLDAWGDQDDQDEGLDAWDDGADDQDEADARLPRPAVLVPQRRGQLVAPPVPYAAGSVRRRPYRPSAQRVAWSLAAGGAIAVGLAMWRTLHVLRIQPLAHAHATITGWMLSASDGAALLWSSYGLGLGGLAVLVALGAVIRLWDHHADKARMAAVMVAYTRLWLVCGLLGLGWYGLRYAATFAPPPPAHLTPPSIPTPPPLPAPPPAPETCGTGMVTELGDGVRARTAPSLAAEVYRVEPGVDLRYPTGTRLTLHCTATVRADGYDWLEVQALPDAAVSAWVAAATLDGVVYVVRE